MLTLTLLFSLSLHARARAPKIELSSPIIAKLEMILIKADELRQALVIKQDQIATARMHDLVRALSETRHTADPDRQNKQHLDRILGEAQKSLEEFAASKGEGRRVSLQNAFKQLVLIGQTYKTKGNFKFFFCNRDRSVWIQQESKPKNPINPENFLNCGTRVE